MFFKGTPNITKTWKILQSLASNTIVLLQTSRDLYDIGSPFEKHQLVPVSFVEFQCILVISRHQPARDGWRVKVWCRIKVVFVTAQQNTGL